MHLARQGIIESFMMLHTHHLSLKTRVAWLLVSLLMLMAGQAQALTATSQPISSIIIVEADVAFDEALVRQAISPLEAHNLRIVVILAQAGDEADFTARLEALGLVHGSKLSEDVVALYVAIDTRYSEIMWNTRRYDRVIPDLNLRRTAMNPLLRDGLYDKAFENTLRVLEESLASFEPKESVATSAPTAPPSSSSAPSGTASTVWDVVTTVWNVILSVVCLIIAIIGAAGVVALIVAPMFSEGPSISSDSDGPYRIGSYDSGGSDGGGSDSGGSDSGGW